MREKIVAGGAGRGGGTEHILLYQHLWSEASYKTLSIAL